jgi:phage-related minor tail protein
VLSAENLLLTFTSIGKDVFPQATKTVLDMSTALGQDTKASAIQLGKALNDPIVGVTALRRVGVQFTESQQDQIKVLVESGQKMQAQKLILAELATEFGGSATAQAQTFEGRLMQMNNQIDDVKEKIGEALVKGLTPFIQKISDFVASPAGQQFADGLTKSIERFFKFLSDNKDTIMAILNGIAFVFKIIGEAISFVFRMITSVGDALGQVLLKIDRFSQKASNVPILGGLFKKIADVLPFAEGGNFSAGQPMLVGERGPELIVPQNSGTVIPNHNMGSNISITFTGPVSMQSDQQIDEIGRRLAKQIELVRQGAL